MGNVFIQINAISKETRPYTLPPVADGWAGAVQQKKLTFCWAGAEMPKSLAIQKCDGPTDRPTDRLTNRQTDTASSRVACPRLKIIVVYQNLQIGQINK